MKTNLYDVSGLVDPTWFSSPVRNLTVTDTAGDEREIDLCWDNVSQGCFVYTQAQVRATCEIQAQDLVSAMVGTVLDPRDRILDLVAEETDIDVGY